MKHYEAYKIRFAVKKSTLFKRYNLRPYCDIGYKGFNVAKDVFNGIIFIEINNRILNVTY